MAKLNQTDIKGIYVGGNKVFQICLGDQSIFPEFPKPLEKTLSEKYAPSEPIGLDDDEIDMEWIEHYSNRIMEMSNRQNVEVEITQEQQEYLNQLADDLFGEEEDDED